MTWRFAVFLKILCPALMLAAPAALAAQSSPAAPYETVSATGQTRPVAKKLAPPMKCHPEASKAVSCEAQARVQHAKAMANARAGQRLSAR